MNSAQRKELELKEIEQMSKRYGEIIWILFSGGEPFLRNDLDKIVSLFNKNNKTCLFSIPTNGLEPEKIGYMFRKMLKEAKGAFFNISLSLDGIGDKHDELRGVKGGFTKVIQTYNYLNLLRRENNKFSIQICTTVSKYNVKNIKEIGGYVRKNLDVDSHLFGLYRCSSPQEEVNYFSWEETNYLFSYAKKQISSKRQRFLFHKIGFAVLDMVGKFILDRIRYKRRSIHCLAGRRMIIISDIGEIFPCETLAFAKEEKKEIPGNDFLMGSLRESGYDVKKILCSPKAKEIKKFIRESQCCCLYSPSLINSIMFNPRFYPRIIRKILKG